MKQLSLLTLLLCLFAGLGRATTLSGVVTNAASQPVASQVVYVTDSTSNPTNPTFLQTSTNASGQYNFNLPTFTTGTVLHVFTFACGTTYTNVVTYGPNTTLTSNFSICGGTPANFVLKGNITLGGIANTGMATLYLIQKSYNPATQSWNLAAIDTIQTNNTGAYSRTYSTIPSGDLLLKVALDAGHPNYAAYMPTYYISALNWSGADSLTVSNFTNNANTNINMIAGTNPGGPGFIGGSVLQGANKSTAVGDPLNKRLVLLTTAAGQAVAYTYSNAQGQFSFPNLAYGTYKLFGDAWGKTNPPLTVTISAAQASINNITFEENDKKFEAHIGGLGIGSLTGLTGVSIYPNPATDYVQVSGLEAIKGDKTLVLTGVNGALILKQDIVAGQSARVPTASLSAGIYFLQVNTAAGNARFKLVK